ncbi:MAG: hypothetical protein ACR2HH_16975 [Chthoniobacterales bacterium]
MLASLVCLTKAGPDSPLAREHRTVLNLDTAPDEKLLATIRASEDIRSAQVIQL